MKSLFNLSAPKIFATFSGLALLVFATLFGISTIVNNPIQADSPATTNATGKIMMHQNGFVHNGNLLYHVLVWDTETGKSKLHYFSTSTSTIKKASYQLPSSPLY